MQPTKKFIAGPVSATVWTNKTKEEDGEYKTISIDRNYKDSDGNWKSTNVLRSSDIPRAILVLNKAYEFITLKQEV
ncbi:hypothetical protein JXM83_05830 [Candidatus Woesearchaeota archaeon]|nr:hypothetical protein [Candidatus Woesearchaeota archaeon]